MKRVLLFSFGIISILGMYLYFRMLKAVNLGLNYQDTHNNNHKPHVPPRKVKKNGLNGDGYVRKNKNDQLSSNIIEDKKEQQQVNVVSLQKNDAKNDKFESPAPLNPI